VTKGCCDTGRSEDLVNIPLVDEKLAMRLSYDQEEPDADIDDSQDSYKLINTRLWLRSETGAVAAYGILEER
jgi:hypothetical protein